MLDSVFDRTLSERAGSGTFSVSVRVFAPLLLLLLSVAPAAATPSLRAVASFPVGPNNPSKVNGLDKAFGVAVSPDGAHIYATGDKDDAVAVFRLSGDLETLEFVAHYDGIAGLDGAHSVVVSPDGAHVYVAGRLADSVVAFSRDAGAGTLTYLESYVDGGNGGLGLDHPTGVTISPDGAHVYVAAAVDDAITTFERDGGTGLLTHVQTVTNFPPAGLDGVHEVTVSPDGANVYSVSSFDGVSVFERDAGTGALSFIEAHLDGGVSGLDFARAVAVSPDGTSLYAVGTSDDALILFDRDLVTGKLTFVEKHDNGVAGVEGLDAPHWVIVSPDGANVYVAGEQSNAVTVFDRDGGSGELTFATAHTSPFHSRPRVLAIDPAGAHLYVVADFSSSLTMYRRDQVTGELALNESITDNEARERARSLRLSPDDAHVYVASPNRDGVEVYSRDPASGGLTFVERQQDGVAGVSGLQGAWSVAVSPDGGHVYVAGTESDAIAVFGRDGGSGALTFVEAQVDGSAGVDGLAGVRGIAVSSDGAHVYVAGDVDDALAVFSRDSGTGALTFVEALFDGSGGVDGLDGARDVSISPDGDHVYVAAAADDAVAVFSRDSGSGQLTFVEAKTDGAGGADYLDGASALAVSGDGAQVYVVAAFDGALTVFDRDSGSGSLTFAEVHVDSPSIGLQRAGSVAVSADGGSVYATAEISHSLVRFERDLVTGALTDAQMERDGLAGANTLKGAASVALTAEGGIYVAAHIDGAATLFETTAVCPLEPMPGCRSPRKSRLLVRDHDDDQKDKIVYKWQFGDETPTEAFGNPENEGGTDYALCVYDLRGGTTELRFDAFVPSGRTCGNRDKPCWRPHFGSYIFKDRDATPEGVQRLYLRHGPDGSPFVSVVGKGVNLRALPGIPMGPPVTAQVINSDGECWSTTFTADDVKKNKPLPRDVFNARQ